MEKLKLPRRTIRYMKTNTNVIKVKRETMEIIEEIAIETGFTKTEVTRRLVDYAYNNMEYVEEEEN